MSVIQIVILRHAEKPGDPAQDQPADGISLSVRGFARASALAYLLPNHYQSPSFLFATQQSKHSNRPIETVTPLSERLGLSINSDYVDHDYADLATRLLDASTFDGKTIIVCWHHGTIPQLAAALGVVNPPTPWSSTVFDRYWQITVGDNGAVLTDLPQQALYGDRSE